MTRINRDISDVQLKSTVTNTLSNVRNAYWDYVFAVQSVDVSQQIVDLANMLNRMGAKIRGAGSPRIVIDGVEALGGCEHRVMPDRIVAGTFLIGAAMTAGDVYVRGARAEHLESLLEALMRAGCRVDIDARGIRARMTTRPRAVGMVTAPFPGFPTDLQAQMMALMSTASGASMITETIFENRFMHVPELNRMGARINVHGSSAIVRGVPHLSGAPVMASDLRASLSLILAGLAAKGETVVNRVYHLDRGYDRIEDKLSAVGAKIRRIQA